MDEQREQQQEGQEQRPAAEATGEVADADLEQVAGGRDGSYRWVASYSGDANYY